MTDIEQANSEPSNLVLRHVHPSAQQLAQRRHDLRWQRRIGNVQRWLASKRPERKLLNGMKHSHSLALGPHAPLAELDACGFQYPRVSVQVSKLKRQLADWLVITKPGRRDPAELASLSAFNSIDYFVLQGRWRPVLLKHAAASVEQEAAELMEFACDYRKTASYQRLLETMARQQLVRRQGRILQEKAQLDAYFERFCVLFRSIEQHGLLAPEHVSRKGLTTNLDRPLGVALGAKGNFFRLQGGNHRWAIAKVLGIEHVEVELRMVHPAAAEQAFTFLNER